MSLIGFGRTFSRVVARTAMSVLRNLPGAVVLIIQLCWLLCRVLFQLITLIMSVFALTIVTSRLTTRRSYF